MISSKTLIISVLVAAGLAAAVTRFYFPQVKTQTVETEKQVVHDNIVTVTHTVTKPDGSTDTTTTVQDHSTKIATDTTTATTYRAAVNSVSALAGSDISSGRLSGPIYGIQYQRQVLGPINVGVFGLTNGVVGVSLGITF